MSRLKRSVLALFLVAAMGATTVGCRAGLRLAAAVAVVGAVTAVRVATVALLAASWYAITRPVYIYYQPAVRGAYVSVPASSRIYVISRSRDGRWYYIRTSDGRAGWVPAHSLRGCYRI